MPQGTSPSVSDSNGFSLVLRRREKACRYRERRPGRLRSSPDYRGPQPTLVHGGERDRSPPAFLPFQAARTESGRPRPNMRLSALTAIWISTSWAGPAWERSVSPITRASCRNLLTFLVTY